MTFDSPLSPSPRLTHLCLFLIIGILSHQLRFQLLLLTPTAQASSFLPLTFKCWLTYESPCSVLRPGSPRSTFVSNFMYFFSRESWVVIGHFSAGSIDCGDLPAWGLFPGGELVYLFVGVLGFCLVCPVLQGFVLPCCSCLACSTTALFSRLPLARLAHRIPKHHKRTLAARLRSTTFQLTPGRDKCTPGC